MSYVSLYRNYRPATFDDVIGQDHIVRTLRNQIANNRVGHAYLFTGTRGTGKTTCAKIFSKAINCLAPQNGSPCGVCDVCRVLSNPNNLDILEIDAASNNGVDEIRDLREKVKFTPTCGRFKVYIIDEVHMLSSSAFNALLKTLEEPPSHVVFILATTEAQKLPQTILSRCLRFDFRLVANDLLIKLIARIFDDIKKPYEREALISIANAGEGSVRDTISIADMCLSYCTDKITYADTLEVLGASSPESVLDICINILDGNVGGALKKIDEVAGFGKNLGLLASDIAKTLRNMIFARNCDDANDALVLPKEFYLKLLDKARSFDNAKILYALGIMSEIEFKQKFSAQPRVLLECAVAKACDSKASFDVDALLLRIRELEKRIDSGAVAVSGQSTTQNTATPTRNVKNIWAKIVASIKASKSLSLYSAIIQDDNEIDFNNGIIVLRVAKRANFDFLVMDENRKELEVTAMKLFDFVRGVEIICEQKVDKTGEEVGKIMSMFDKDVINIKK